jgi:hypothetical protein
VQTLELFEPNGKRVELGIVAEVEKRTEEVSSTTVT